MEANPRDRWRRKRFKENLDRLLTERGLTRKAASDAAKVDYDWLRRAVSRGIAWPDKRSMEWLKKLADTLGLDDVERLWGRHFVVPPEPSSIKDEAEKFGEEMRQYVLLVGAEDTTLKGIIEQMRRAVRAAKFAKRMGTAPSATLPPPEVPAGVELPSVPTGGPSSPGRSACVVGPSDTPSTPPQSLAERLEQAKRAIAEARAVREAAREEPTSGSSSTTGRETSLPPQEPQPAVGAGDRSGGPAKDGADNEVAQRHAGSSIGRPRSEREGGLIAELARRILVDFDHQYVRGFREVGLPRAEEVTLTAAEFLTYAESGRLDLSGDDAFHLAYLPWLEKYGSLLGTTWQTADSYVRAWRFFWERRLPSVGGVSPGERPPDGMDDLRRLSPEALIARHGEEWRREIDEEVRRSRAEARPLVASVLEALSPGQHDHFFGGFASRERGELYLLDELVRRIRDAGIDGDRSLPMPAPDEAVRAVVAEIVQEHERSLLKEGVDDPGLPVGEPEILIAPDRPLEARHGDDLPTDDDDDHHRLTSPPVGAASGDEEKEPIEEAAEEILEWLSDLTLATGKGSYRDGIRRFGEPRSVVKVALRDAQGDVGKALKWLVEKVKSTTEAGPSIPLRRAGATPARGGDIGPPTRKPQRDRQPDKMSPEDLHRYVVEARGDGLGVREIVESLRSEADKLPEWIRSKSRTEMAEMVSDILGEEEQDDDEDDSDEFDPKAEDDKRSWEMEY